MSVEATAETMGAHLLRELQWIHGAIRNDLAICQELAGRVAAGLPAEAAREQIRSMQTKSPLWKLRTNGLYYCQFVHHHHRLEDTAFFPMLRRSNAALGPVVDKLEADHRKVSGLLDEIEAGANALAAMDSGPARERLVFGLGALAAELLAHLDYEEKSIGPTLTTWTEWPV